MTDSTTTPTSWFERTTDAADALGLRLTKWRSREGIKFELYLLPAGEGGVTTLFTTAYPAELEAFLMGFSLASHHLAARAGMTTCPNCSGSGRAAFVGHVDDPCRLCAGRGYVRPE